MLFAVLTALFVIFLLSLPFWAGRQIIKLREYIFLRVNGDTGTTVPNEAIPAAAFKVLADRWPRVVNVSHFNGCSMLLKELYEHPGMRYRSRQATVGLSDLFWCVFNSVYDRAEFNIESYTAISAGTSWSQGQMCTRSTWRRARSSTPWLLTAPSTCSTCPSRG